MCFDPLSATALLLALDRGGHTAGGNGNGCGCQRRDCGCGGNRPRRELRQETRQEGREESSDNRELLEEIAERRARARACSRSVPCTGDVVRPAATRWSDGAPTRYR